MYILSISMAVIVVGLRIREQSPCQSVMPIPLAKNFLALCLLSSSDSFYSFLSQFQSLSIFSLFHSFFFFLSLLLAVPLCLSLHCFSLSLSFLIHFWIVFQLSDCVLLSPLYWTDKNNIRYFMQFWCFLVLVCNNSYHL